MDLSISCSRSTRQSPSCHSAPPSYHSTASGGGGEAENGTRTPLSSVCSEIPTDPEICSRKPVPADEDTFEFINTTEDDGNMPRSGFSSPLGSQGWYIQSLNATVCFVTIRIGGTTIDRRVHVPACAAFDQAQINPEGCSRMAVLSDADGFVLVDLTG
jgi:hypothetical protein